MAKRRGRAVAARAAARRRGRGTPGPVVQRQERVFAPVRYAPARDRQDAETARGNIILPVRGEMFISNSRTSLLSTSLDADGEDHIVV